MPFFVGWVERSGTQHRELVEASRGPYLQEIGDGIVLGDARRNRVSQAGFLAKQFRINLPPRQNRTNSSPEEEQNQRDDPTTR